MYCVDKAAGALRAAGRELVRDVTMQAEKEPSDVKPWEKPVFGVPMAPTEIWQGFAQQHRCKTASTQTAPTSSLAVQILCPVW